ncbi:MAG: hypothetical protein ACYTGL_29345 [Planctomycetota bacterium]
MSQRDQRKDCELHVTDGKLKVNVRELEAGTSLIDFNFFAFSPHQTAGVYQHYRGAMGLTDFGNLLKGTYEKERVRRLRAAEKKRPQGTSITRHAKNVRAKYRRDFDWAALVRPEDFPKLLEELKKIREFKFKLTSPCVVEPLFSPISDHIRQQTKVVRFVEGSPARTIASVIRTAVSDLELTDVSVEGSDSDGESRVYRILENPSVFDEREYDSLADTQTLNLRDVGSSPFAGELIDILNSRPELFGKQQ